MHRSDLSLISRLTYFTNKSGQNYQLVNNSCWSLIYSTKRTTFTYSLKKKRASLFKNQSSKNTYNKGSNRLKQSNFYVLLLNAYIMLKINCRICFTFLKKLFKFLCVLSVKTLLELTLCHMY